jgi:hypothetical protein
MVQIVKDKKGKCYILSNQRCGITESIFLTKEELTEAKEIIEREFK